MNSLGQCQICGKESNTLSDQLGVCLQCIRETPKDALKVTDKVHAESRAVFGLPSKPPKDPDGLLCGICSNNCQIGVGEKGFCGLVFNRNGQLVRIGGTAAKGILQWYYDPLPTNCVAWWFCPGCTGTGYPKYAYKPTAETGYANLAVFYGSCSLDCLYCQNWHYRDLASRLAPVMSAESLAAKADSSISRLCVDKGESRQVERVSCICFFGGDPSSQILHALGTSELALEKARKRNRILRICWETNGYWQKELALKVAHQSLQSGGVIKFDLKTWNDNLSRALCGASNKPTLNSFKLIGERFWEERPEVPILTASTLLVPGYVDAKEIEALARFIADIDPEIPYTLLAFHPHYVMNDLPTTSRDQANVCYTAAKKYLQNVRLGNIQLLS